MSFELLYRMQELEIKEAEMRYNIKRLPQYKELKKLKEQFERQQKNHEEKRILLHNISLSLKGLEDKAAALETKQQEMNKVLYDGSIGNPKELENLEQQINTLKNQVSAINDEIIFQMEQKEKMEQETAQMEKELRQQYREFNELKSGYQRVKLNLEQELAGILEEKSEIVSRIETKWMAWYEKKKVAFAGTPVGKIMDNHACSGCRTVIPITLVKKARTAPGTVYCEQCGRVLFAPSIY